MPNKWGLNPGPFNVKEHGTSSIPSHLDFC